MPVVIGLLALAGVAWAIKRSSPPSAFCLVDPDTNQQICYKRPLSKTDADHLTYVASNPKVPQAVADSAKNVLIADGYRADAQAITDLENNTSVPV